MWEIRIENSDGQSLFRDILGAGDYVIGKDPSCHFAVADRYLSRRHLCLQVSRDGLVLDDQNSTNGSWYEGSRLSASRRVTSAGAVVLGKGVTVSFAPCHGPANPATTPEPASPDTWAVIKDIQVRILEILGDGKRGDISQLTYQQLRDETRRVAQKLIDNGEVVLPARTDSDALINNIVAEAIGFGPIEPFLEDESITEIMVNGPDQIYIERAGKLQPVAVRFSNNQALMSVIERIVSPLGRRIDEGNPMIDARLPDGSRVNAIIPPLALTGPTLTIRKFSKTRMRMADLVRYNTLSPEMAEFLRVCVKYRRNIVVSGGTGSGKTTTLNILSDFIPEDERILTIEDSAELQLSQPHVVSLESRPNNVEGRGEVAIRDLVRNSLRMRPDRIVIGECRGGEALDMLQAMNTGHDGSLTTGHANSPRDMLARLETMVMMSGVDLPSRAIREQISSAVDIIVQQMRTSDGSRRIVSIAEVGAIEGDVISLQEVFVYRQDGVDNEGRVFGRFEPRGYAPSFYEPLKRGGIDLDWSIFETDKSAEPGPRRATT